MKWGRLFVFAFVVVAIANIARAQNAPEILQSEQRQVIDDLGNAKLSITMKLTAKQYMLWKQKYGSNPSILRRDMGRLISQYETSNFKVDQDDMDRQIRVTFDAQGVVDHKGGGAFEFKVPKEWTGGQRVDNEYRFNFVQQISPGALMQHNISTLLPTGATDIQDQLSEEGEKVIQYTLPQSGHGTMWLLGTGAFGLIGLAGVGVGLMSRPAAGTPAAPAAPPAEPPAAA